MFVIELAAPFLIFAPRRLRFIGCHVLILFQTAILLTGNYCFFNLLTIALCLLLLDDAAMKRLLPARLRPRFGGQKPAPEPPSGEEPPILAKITVPPAPLGVPGNHCRSWPAWLTAPLAIVIIVVTLGQVLEKTFGLLAWVEPVDKLDEWLGPLRSVNTYGLFMVMTTSRPEIIIEGSNDGRTWLPYEFKYKPGDPKRRPAFVAPHQPRLDWQMWFAALGNYRQNPWLVNFCVRLLQGSPDVLALMGKNPFPNAPPRYIRAVVYEYHFCDFQERRAEGVWWKREYQGQYLPPISLSGG